MDRIGMWSFESTDDICVVGLIDGRHQTFSSLYHISNA
jgi:hypothetical protein